MIIRNSIALTIAVAAGITSPLLVTSFALLLNPFAGAAAFTTALCAIGGSLMGGLLGLVVLGVLMAIATYIFIQIQLAWMPV
ncbi:MAG: hypothetical protein WBA57_09125 [Elainellaceae cyanobacterium]